MDSWIWPLRWLTCPAADLAKKLEDPVKPNWVAILGTSRISGNHLRLRFLNGRHHRDSANQRFAIKKGRHENKWEEEWMKEYSIERV